MTREEAINELQNNKQDDTFIMMDDAIDMAIEALSAESCEDCIDRENVLIAFSEYLNSGFANSIEDFEEYANIVKKEPSVQPKHIECEDCISRTQAIKAMDELENEDIEAYGCSIPEGFDGERARQAICLLPSVQPKPKTGHWIALENRFVLGDRLKCSECGQDFVVGDEVSRNYCPNCGAKMESEG